MTADPLVEAPAFRDVCWRCRRPRSVCWCEELRPVASQTRVVFVQHPREVKVAVSTCRMAHLSLPNSELHIGLGAVGNARLEAVCRQPGVAVLFPSEGATDLDDLAEPPRTLVVVDGTWSNAKKVVEKCPLLSKLPRLKFRPEQPGNYRIRKEPNEHSLATIEAITYVLERLEQAPGRFVPLLGVFTAMVDRQLQFIESNDHRSSRHKFSRRRNSVPFDPLAELRGLASRLVVVFGEANAWPLDRSDRPPGDQAELVQLVAERLATSQRFSSMLKPTRPLGPTVAFHLDVAQAALLDAPERAQVIAQWRLFSRPDDVLVGWGTFCQALLEAEGVSCAAFVNLRGVLAHVSKTRPGSVEARARQQGVALPEGQGRALRRLVALSAVTRATLSPLARDGLLQVEQRSNPHE